MNTIITLILCTLMLFNGQCAATGEATETDIRYASGEITCRMYDSENDCFNVIVTTEDGNEWELDDCGGGYKDSAIVQFDTKGTDNVDDDEVTALIIVEDFSE